MEIIKINEHLSFVAERTKKGYKLTCIYDGISIGYKNPCPHVECNTRFIAEMSIAADQMHRFEQALEPNENLN